MYKSSLVSNPPSIADDDIQLTQLFKSNGVRDHFRLPDVEIEQTLANTSNGTRDWFASRFKQPARQSQKNKFTVPTRTENIYQQRPPVPLPPPQSQRDLTLTQIFENRDNSSQQFDVSNNSIDTSFNELPYNHTSSSLPCSAFNGHGVASKFVLPVSSENNKNSRWDQTPVSKVSRVQSNDVSHVIQSCSRFDDHGAFEFSSPTPRRTNNCSTLLSKPLSNQGVVDNTLTRCFSAEDKQRKSTPSQVKASISESLDDVDLFDFQDDAITEQVTEYTGRSDCLNTPMFNTVAGSRDHFGDTPLSMSGMLRYQFSVVIRFFIFFCPTECSRLFNMSLCKRC